MTDDDVWFLSFYGQDDVQRFGRQGRFRISREGLFGRPRDLVSFQLESLILAQNERWRQA